ncbi:hypothetical protein [Nocardia neocaledoniensis]|uniref:hypothetical protein n=1 Tax=Nocardia neocaledoniensis TaxID=236511 RepID=UPI002456D6C0|nr:hypothetical protein [Nocardia neocaledoniensis]
MTTVEHSRCTPVQWLQGLGWLAGGLLAGCALLIAGVFALWPLATWAVVYGPILAMTIWLVGASIYALRTHGRRRDPRRSLFTAGAGVAPVYYGVIMLVAHMAA